MSRILGIDPGKDGAAVLIEGRTVLAQARTADILGGASWQAGHPLVSGFVRGLHAMHRIDLAVLELYAGRAGQGRGSMLTIGVGWGLWLGVLSGLGISVRTPRSASVSSALFKGIAGEGKERGIAFASQELPDLDLMPGRCRKPHDGLADAGCLAVWGERL